MRKDDIFQAPLPDALLKTLENDQARERFLSLTASQRKAMISASRGMLPNEMRAYFDKLLLN